MAYRVQMSETARRSFRALDGTMQGRVAAAVNALADNSRPPGVKRMRGKSPDGRCICRGRFLLAL